MGTLKRKKTRKKMKGGGGTDDDVITATNSFNNLTTDQKKAIIIWRNNNVNSITLLEGGEFNPRIMNAGAPDSDDDAKKYYDAVKRYLPQASPIMIFNEEIRGAAAGADWAEDVEQLVIAEQAEQAELPTFDYARRVPPPASRPAVERLTREQKVDMAVSVYRALPPALLMAINKRWIRDYRNNCFHDELTFKNHFKQSHVIDPVATLEHQVKIHNPDYDEDWFGRIIADNKPIITPDEVDVAPAEFLLQPKQPEQPRKKSLAARWCLGGFCKRRRGGKKTRKRSKHKQSKHKRTKHKQSKHKQSKHKQSKHKRSKRK